MRQGAKSANALPYFFRRPLLLMVLAVAGGWAVVSPFFLKSGYDRSPLVDGRPALAIGRVAGVPRRTSGGDSFPLSLRWVQRAGHPAVRAEGTLWVHRSIPAVSVDWGDTVSLWGPWKRNRMFVPPGKSAFLSRPRWADPLRWAGAVRHRCQDVFFRLLSERDAGVLSGIVLGERPASTSDLSEDFRSSGTYHLLVASGGNVGFVIVVWWLATRWLLWWPWKATVATIPLAAFVYALVAGGDPPVLRAAVMAAVFCVCQLSGRWDSPVHGLFLSALCVLAWDPSSLFQAGFQLSYLATGALALAWNGAPSKRGNPLLHGAGTLFKTSFIAQAGLAPLLLHDFGRFSWVGVFSNMLAVPLAGICLWSGAGMVILDSFGPSWGACAAAPAEWCLRALVWWARLWARVPGGEIRGFISGTQAGILVVGVLGAIWMWHKSRRFGSVVFAATGLGISMAIAPMSRVALHRVEWMGGRPGRLMVLSPEGSRIFSSDAQETRPGPTGVSLVRPPGGNGYGMWVDLDGVKGFAGFGLTPRQQRDLLSQARPVAWVSWQSGGGGPPLDDLLRRLSPRRTLVLGPRIPASVRREGGKALRVDSGGWVCRGGQFDRIR